MKKFFSEPLIQFLILGGILFFLISYVQKKNDDDHREIVVDNERIALLITNYKSQTGNLPSKLQLDVMIDQYIKEEIQYREAMKLGLDKDDEIIRRRLAQKLSFMQSDLTEEKSPDESTLKQFYSEHPTLFKSDATVSFSHFYFSTDKRSDSNTKQIAINALQQLKQSSLTRAPEKGDRFSLQYDFTNQSLIDIQQNFGNTEISDSLFQSPLQVWVGPVRSGYGWHLIYISHRDSSATLPFATVKGEVKTKYAEYSKSVQDKISFEKLSKGYTIVRSYMEPK